MTSPIQSAPHEFEPKIGDMVRIVAVDPESNMGAFRAGEIVTLGRHSKRQSSKNGFRHLVFDANDPKRNGCFANLEPTPPAAEPMVEMLPKGTRFQYSAGTQYEFVSDAGWDAERKLWVGRHQRITDGKPTGYEFQFAGGAEPIQLIPKPAPPPGKTSAGSAYPFVENCGDCGRPIENALESCKRKVWSHTTQRHELLPGSFHTACAFKTGRFVEERTDPYAKTEQDEGIAYADTNFDNRQIAKQRIAALEKGDALSRLAARRSRHKAEVLRDMSRDVREWTNWKGERVSFWGKGEK